MGKSKPVSVKLPASIDKKTLKKYKRQRVRWGFSDYDCMDLDFYLCAIIPNAIEQLLSFKHGYSDSLWMLDTKEVKKGLTPEEYDAELRWYVQKFRDTVRSVHYGTSFDEISKADEMTVPLFEWLGHNIHTLWD